MSAQSPYSEAAAGEDHDVHHVPLSSARQLAVERVPLLWQEVLEICRQQTCDSLGWKQSYKRKGIVDMMRKSKKCRFRSLAMLPHVGHTPRSNGTHSTKARGNVLFQASLLLGKSLLCFMHPDEQEATCTDLADALKQKNMHRSVTRVRYCRLPRVHHFLAYAGLHQPWNDSDKASSSELYMPIDIVISWATAGLVLHFTHAVPELDLMGIKEHHKLPWTTWCGMPVSDCCSTQSKVLSRVFQILTNSSNEDYQLLLTWPPDTSHEYSSKPSAKDFARRVGGTLPSSHNANVNMSCTKRWQIWGPMPTINDKVESIFIPHGSWFA
ncbi:hypothetical protein F5141DRAFT_1066799 [Pisolithus sp. B1]|nr:hypothetical protein F5141DRAFT_1066799 [Pisolithus sp. B1]